MKGYRLAAAVVVVVVLALGAGVAFATTQTTASGGTTACVNDGSGVVRVASACRAGEHPLTIGTGNGQVTSGEFTLAAGETGGAKVLPLTGATLSGLCTVQTGAVLAQADIEAPAGSTMDVIPGGIGRSSALLTVAHWYADGSDSSIQHSILNTNAATATLSVGGKIDPISRACTFLWQAVEAPN